MTQFYGILCGFTGREYGFRNGDRLTHDAKITALLPIRIRRWVLGWRSRLSLIRGLGDRRIAYVDLLVLIHRLRVSLRPCASLLQFLWSQAMVLLQLRLGYSAFLFCALSFPICMPAASRGSRRFTLIADIEHPASQDESQHHYQYQHDESAAMSHQPKSKWGIGISIGSLGGIRGVGEY